MNKVITKFLLLIAITWCVISVLYLLAGLLIVLHLEKDIASVFKSVGGAEIISVLAAICSAIATIAAAVSSSRSAVAAEEASIYLSRADRIKTRDAILATFNMLNIKCTVLRLDEKNPEQFLISEEEMRVVSEQRDAIISYSHAYGKSFHQRLVSFFFSLKIELNGQNKLCDIDVGFNPTLTKATQEKYLKYREEKRDEAASLFEEANKRLYEKSVD